MNKPTTVFAALALVGLTIIGGVYFRFRTSSGHAARSTIVPQPASAGSALVKAPLTQPEAAPESSATVTAPTPQRAFDAQFASRILDVEQVSSVSFEALPSVMALELAQAQPGITVDDWQRSHPAEKWEKSRCNSCQESNPAAVKDDTNDINVGDDCAVFTHTWELGSYEKLIRKAVFVIPAPPPSMDLPDQKDPDTVVKMGCVIGAVYIEERGNRSGLASLQDALPNELTNQFGPPSNEVSAIKHLAFFDGSVSTWKRDRARIVMKSLRVGNEPSVGALAYLPGFDFDAPIGYQELVDLARQEYSEANPKMFDLGIRTASVDEKTSRPLVNIFQNRITPEYPTDRAARSLVPAANAARVAAALQTWLAVTKSLPPQRRAGALLAADCVLDVSLSQFGDSATAHKQLETVGVKIYEQGYGFDHDSSLIEQARNLDPDGPIGEAIMMMVFSSLTWDSKLVPKGYDRTVDYVIAAGEKYLSKPRNPDLVPRVEYYVASAYCDIVAESQGDGDYPPTTQQIEQGIAARPFALKHYRALLTVDKKSKWGLDAWLNSWRILAKLQLGPHYPSFDL